MEFALYCGRQQGDPSPVAVVALAAEHPSPQSLQQLEHETRSQAKSIPHGQPKPLALTRREGRTILVLKDSGGEPEADSSAMPGQPLDLSPS